MGVFYRDNIKQRNQQDSGLERAKFGERKKIKMKQELEDKEERLKEMRAMRKKREMALHYL